MQIADAMYTDAERAALSAVVDGVRMWIPCDPRNRHYREVLDRGIEVAPFARAPSFADVKAEAQRRIIALTGKTTLQDCMIKQFNALMRAGQLTDKRVNVGALTAEEETEAARLRALADQIKAIRAASDAIEAMSPIPADYAADSRWPG